MEKQPLLVDLIPLIKGFCLIVFCLGVVSIFKDIGMNQEDVRGFLYPYMFIYSHPTYLTTGLICILCILNAADRLSKVDDIIILSTIVLAMRTKGFAFIAVYVFLKYGSHWVKKLQIIYWPIIGIIVFFVARSKLLLYTSFSNSPRESLYMMFFCPRNMNNRHHKFHNIKIVHVHNWEVKYLNRFLIAGTSFF